MQKPQFVEDRIYHIYNRGVEKRNVFLDKKDYFRFIHDLYEFNDENSVLNLAHRLTQKSIEVEPRYNKRKKRKLLVEILAFVLMPNHFHLLLRQLEENGIIRFMQKLGGYTMYFNKKYERVGSLFQGRYKAVLVEKESHFTYLPIYIHANPLKIYRGSTSINDAMRFLEEYRWSSFPDYMGKKNFPSLTSRQFLFDSFGGEKIFRKEMKETIGDLFKHKYDNFSIINNVALDQDFEEDITIEVQPR
jgi:putative transposase